ncbi:hypothetical protein [Shewanella sp. NIFS-20-20]|uniref:hypothetical protein n=1 Tax=Shewanella sp. NIFS-20-20 TaxID=2853806 RepID=UPI001C459558|nr:hypothetical protein [Shewanella sp. NIFS-20-20]MBV7315777.1 hypothetical protein [Shewanella sp. NIFS-20-20]
MAVFLLVTGIVFASVHFKVLGSEDKPRASAPLPNVIATAAMDQQALTILAGFSPNRREEQARAVMCDGTQVSPTRCNNHSCTFELDTSQVKFVVHTHVKCNNPNKAVARLITKSRELPGPGDHVFLELGQAPNYFKTPKGNVRVLEYRDGAYRLRTVTGDGALERQWQPFAGEPSISEINRALRQS